MPEDRARTLLPPSLARAGRTIGGDVRALVHPWRDLTPGQRQTSVLAVVLAVAMLQLGLPRDPTGPTSATASEAASAAPPPPAAEAGGEAVAAPAPQPGSVVTAAPASPASRGTAAAPSGGATSDGGALPEPRPPVPDGATAGTVVILVGEGASLYPGRDDASISSAFLQSAPFPYEVVATEAPPAEVCQKAVTVGRLVLAGDELAPELRHCLVAAGATVVAFDALGDLPPAEEGGGQVVSTRRGVAASLIDLARWGARSKVLRGKVGLVVSAAHHDLVESAVVPAVRAAGVDLVVTSSVREGAEGDADVGASVRAFAAAGVEAVVFALPVSQQVRWAAQAAVLRPGLRYVVSDVADGILNEAYPPLFDGAYGHTALRLPWFQRTHEPTPAQQLCERVWQASSPPQVAVSNTDLARVFMWCEHVDLAARAVLEPNPAADVGSVLRTLLVPSPLTSDLGPLPDGGYGPTADAVVLWDAGCRCWTESQPFSARRPGAA